MNLQFILQHTPGNLYWKDSEGRYLGANQAFLCLTGFKSYDDLIGKTDRELFSSVMSPEKLNLIEETDQRILSSGLSENLKEEGIDANGKPAFYITRKIPLRNEKGDIIGLMGTSLDITKELQADIARSEFLANMRHDIRTPLSGIVGFSELLKAESSEPRIKEYADNLIASSHALLDLMDEVLEAVRVSSGEIPLAQQTFNLTKTMKQVIALYQPRAHEKKLNLSLSLSPALPKLVSGDRIRLHRITHELVSNALNFTDRGFVNLQVDLAKQGNQAITIKITVSDSGMGIPKEKQQEIYQQFTRLTPSYQGVYKGTGLGLYVVKQFVDELGGEIHVVSEPRKGSIFTCLIPLQLPLLDDMPETESPLTLLKPQSLIENQTNHLESKVLVVEDNMIAQTVAKKLLASLNCSVDIASNGVDGLALIEKNHYDLIFMDIGLGDGIDGYEVTHHIRTKHHSTNYTPIIALTAHAGEESKQRCIEAGMDAVLTKPLTQAHAIDILKSFITARHTTLPNTSAQNAVDLPDTEEEFFQLSQFALLNTQEVLKNCETIGMLKELLTIMLEELPTSLDCIKKAFEVQDYSLVEKMTHRIKGSAVYVGTTRMKYACQYVERYWKSGQTKLLNPLCKQAISTIEETIVYVEGWLQRNT